MFGGNFAEGYIDPEWTQILANRPSRPSNWQPTSLILSYLNCPPDTKLVTSVRTHQSVGRKTVGNRRLFQSLRPVFPNGGR